MHTVYVISDLHLGPGRDPATGRWFGQEDFRIDRVFCDFLDQISAGRAPVELVIAGDFIEYPQILPALAHHSPEDALGCDEEESLLRTAAVLGQRPDLAGGHPALFRRLRAFLGAGHSVTVLVGNHDVDLLWPSVWDRLAEALTPRRPGGSLRLAPFQHILGTAEGGRVQIEHGHEHDPSNRYGLPNEPAFGFDTLGVRRLRRCWGTLFVDKVFNQLEPQYWFIDNIKPQTRALQLGLRHNIGFTAQALVLVLRFLLTSRPPIAEMLRASIGDDNGVPLPPDEPSAEQLTNMLADRDLRGFLAAHLADLDFRAALEGGLRALGAGEWHRLRLGAALRPTFDQLAPAPPPSSLEEAWATLSGLEDDDAYLAAARQTLERDPTLAMVIMGHTHTPIDGAELALSDGRVGRYFNTGTWTPQLIDRPGVRYRWADLADSANYASPRTYVVLSPNADGGYQAELRRF
ncbi:MAG TPA: metallophosphoesterase [Roseiflexaceae bacterium]|nr:metallophosphoesterase [Roseiflexaceae bacterium]